MFNQNSWGALGILHVTVIWTPLLSRVVSACQFQQSIQKRKKINNSIRLCTYRIYLENNGKKENRYQQKWKFTKSNRIDGQLSITGLDEANKHIDGRSTVYIYVTTQIFAYQWRRMVAEQQQQCHPFRGGCKTADKARVHVYCSAVNH